MSKDEEEHCLNLSEEDVAVLIAKVDEDGQILLVKMSTASSETKATFSIPYSKLYKAEEKTKPRKEDAFSPSLYCLHTYVILRM